MDALLAVKIGYILLWVGFASVSLWFARREDVKDRLFRLRRKRAR